MKLFVIVLIILGLCVVGMAIKIWGKKGGRFSGTCASQSPYLNPEGTPCSFVESSPMRRNVKNNIQQVSYPKG